MQVTTSSSRSSWSVSGTIGDTVITMRRRVTGWSLILCGALIAVFSERIVFPGLELLLGIETIVGKESVVHLESGGYAYTNPGAMVRWVSSVAVVGVALACIGIWVLVSGRRVGRVQTS